jgi:hypothetical protein
MHLSFTKRKVEICLLEDNRIYVLYQSKVIAESRLSKSNKVIKKDKEVEALLSSRGYDNVGLRRSHKPIKDHPWKKAILAAQRAKKIELQIINI